MESIMFKNETLTVTADPVGAVLHSIVKDGLEYLWQGDSRYWARRDANLFPCVGRSYEGHYRLGGREYPMTLHGFCQDAEFTVTARREDLIRFTLTDNEKTREMYPFAFAFHVEYALKGSSILKTCRVENRGDKTMHFGLGSHPGFNIPLGSGEFSDWYAEFSEPCSPKRVCFDPSNWLLAPEHPAYKLENDRRLLLRHELFDMDAIVLENTPGSVTLRSRSSSRFVRVDYPQMPFVGFWHTPETAAPFVCVEPWLSLPAPNNAMADWETQENLVHLPAGEIYENVITLTIG